jgi:hypothetical protein
MQVDPYNAERQHTDCLQGQQSAFGHIFKYKQQPNVQQNKRNIQQILRPLMKMIFLLRGQSFFQQRKKNSWDSRDGIMDPVMLWYFRQHPIISAQYSSNTVKPADTV